MTPGVDLLRRKRQARRISLIRGSCASRKPRTFSADGGYISSIILVDAHFSHDTPRNSVLDLPFATALGLENLALRHQIGVLQRSARHRPKLTSGDRLLWICLSRLWRDWRSALAIVKPETVIAWHRAGFRLFWTWKVRHGQPGRPAISREIRALLRKMCRENPG